MRAILIPLLATLSLVAPAAAEACELTTSPALICPAGPAPGLPCVETAAAGYYIDEDGCPLLAVVQNCHYSFWVYEESNGIAGLQRDDEIRDDTCRGLIPGDTVIF